MGKKKQNSKIGPDVEIGGTYFSEKHNCNVKLISERSSFSYNCTYERDGEIITDIVKSTKLKNKKS